jgi:hypothetical protein
MSKWRYNSDDDPDVDEEKWEDDGGDDGNDVEEDDDDFDDDDSVTRVTKAYRVYRDYMQSPEKKGKMTLQGLGRQFRVDYRRIQRAYNRCVLQGRDESTIGTPGSYHAVDNLDLKVVAVQIAQTSLDGRATRKKETKMLLSDIAAAKGKVVGRSALQSRQLCLHMW